MKITDKELIVWDSSDEFANDNRDVLLWSSNCISENNSIYSISEIIETNSDLLRKKYLRIIYELGEEKINGVSVVDKLEIRENFSFWWMTLLAEKCNFSKSPEINNIIKLLAFKDCFESQKYKKIFLVSSNNELVDAFRLFSNENGVDFQWKKIPQNKKKKSLPRIFLHWLPQKIQTFIWYVYHTVSHWKLKGVGVSEWIDSDASTTFISYLFNLESSSITNGSFDSKYWTLLPDVLNDKGLSTNWLHLYMKDDLLPSSLKAKNYLNQLNNSKINNQTHTTLHSFISLRLVANVLLDWIRLLRLKKEISILFQKKTSFFWPLFKRDFSLSFTGANALSNLLNLALLENALGCLKNQDKGIYLSENIGWEFGLIHLWKSSGHNTLIGCRHGTVRYWDLRSFFSHESYERRGRCDLPIPDYIGVNGEAAKAIYNAFGYPKTNLIEIEALRYLHLLELKIPKDLDLNINEEKMKVLILGDGVRENVINQAKLVREASAYINKSIQFVFKAHPACPIDEAEFGNIEIEIMNKPIHVLLNDCSLVFAGSVSSAAVDAYCAGKPLVCLLDTSVLNLSPLRGHNGVNFVSNSHDFSRILNNKNILNEKVSQRKNYFYIDSSLKRWKKLLL